MPNVVPWKQSNDEERDSEQYSSGRHGEEKAGSAAGALTDSNNAGDFL